MWFSKLKEKRQDDALHGTVNMNTFPNSMLQKI